MTDGRPGLTGPAAAAAQPDASPATPAAGLKPTARGLLILALAYAALAMLSMLLSRLPGSIAWVWYANAVAAVALARAPPRHWPALLMTVAGANLAVNLAWSPDGAAALVLLVTNLVEIAVAAWALQRAGLADSRLRTSREVLRLLLLGALLPAGVAALVAGALLPLALGGVPVEIAQRWFLSAAIGAVSMLPLALLLANQPRARLRLVLLNARVALLLVAAMAVVWLVLPRLAFQFVYLGLPLLVAAMLAELEAVALLMALMSVAVGAMLAEGLFMPASPGLAVSVYLSLAVALSPALLLAATVAELRDSQQRSLEGEAQLLLANQGLQQFVHMASHDLREPINAIAQFSGLVGQDHGGVLPAEARQYLAWVRAEALRLRLLLDDVLQYSEVQRGDLPPPQPVALSEVMLQVQLALAERLLASAAVLRVGPLPVVKGHATLLNLLLHNLLDNALKFVSPGQAPQVEVNASVAGPDVRLSVTDHGTGIAADHQARLFAPFQRLHRDVTLRAPAWAWRCAGRLRAPMEVTSRCNRHPAKAPASRCACRPEARAGAQRRAPTPRPQRSMRWPRRGSGDSGFQIGENENGGA